MNILILDDDKTVCDVFKARLEREGFVCMTATSTDEAWAKARVLKFDALIVDLDLSEGKQGDQFAAEYKKRHPWTKVFIVSGSEGYVPVPGIEVEKTFLKPVDFEALIPLLNATPRIRPKELSADSVRLDDRDTMLIIELINRVVEHTNIVATSQALITESLEQMVEAMTRNEEKSDFIYAMLKKVDESGILKIYEAVSKFLKEAASKVFWALVVLLGLWLVRNPLLSFLNELLKK